MSFVYGSCCWNVFCVVSAMGRWREGKLQRRVATGRLLYNIIYLSEYYLSARSLKLLF